MSESDLMFEEEIAKMRETVRPLGVAVTAESIDHDTIVTFTHDENILSDKQWADYYGSFLAYIRILIAREKLTVKSISERKNTVEVNLGNLFDMLSRA